VVQLLTDADSCVGRTTFVAGEKHSKTWPEVQNVHKIRMLLGAGLLSFIVYAKIASYVDGTASAASVSQRAEHGNIHTPCNPRLIGFAAHSSTYIIIWLHHRLNRYSL